MPNPGGSEATIADVAAEARVSVRTVSRVLNKSPRVNAETRERIGTAIAKLNFNPSPRARALAMGRSLLIGMVHNDRNALVLDSVQRGITREATARGYELISHSVPGHGEEAIADVTAFARRVRLDGVIVLPPVSGMDGLADALARDKVQAVAISALPIEGYGAMVLSQERQGAAQVAAHLISLGHRDIALITGPLSMISARERREGFVAGLEQAGVGLMVQVEGDYSLASGIAAARQLLDRAKRPSAIFASNDIMAAGVLKVAAEKGIAVPDDLSVVGFDGSILAEMLMPSLTTVMRPFGDMAGIATQQLIDLIEKRPVTDIVSPPLAILPAGSSAARP